MTAPPRLAVPPEYVFLRFPELIGHQAVQVPHQTDSYRIFRQPLGLKSQKRQSRSAMESADISRKDATVMQRVKLFVLGDEAQSKEERWLVQKLG